MIKFGDNGDCERPLDLPSGSGKERVHLYESVNNNAIITHNEEKQTSETFDESREPEVQKSESLSGANITDQRSCRSSQIETPEGIETESARASESEEPVANAESEGKLPSNVGNSSVASPGSSTLSAVVSSGRECCSQ